MSIFWNYLVKMMEKRKRLNNSFGMITRYGFIRKSFAYIWGSSGTMARYYRLCRLCDDYEKRINNNQDDTTLEKYKKMRRRLLRYATRVTKRPFRNEKKREYDEIWTAIVNGELDDEYSKEAQYLRNKGKLELYPYDFSEKYQINEEQIKIDNRYPDLKYIVHEEKKIFFPNDEDKILMEQYRQLVLEQDTDSPHRYFEELGFDCDVFVDVGSAEGIISLCFLKHAKDIYLLECDTKWIKALEATFKENRCDYSNIHIIKKYAGRFNNASEITIDSLLQKHHDKDIVIKMDIEGMELDALYGSSKTMENNNCLFSCTTYHTNDAYDGILSFFKERGYRTSTTKNYMLFIYGMMTLENGKYQKIMPPYFRHGVIRAEKDFNNLK